MNQKDLQDEKTIDYLDQLYPEEDNSSHVKKKAVNLPTLKPGKNDETMGAPGAPIDNLDVLREEINKAIEGARITDSIEREVQDLKDTLQDLDTTDKLKKLKQEIKEDFLNEISSLQKELKDLKDRKIPERRQFETDGAYKEQLYSIAVAVLDKVLIPLINIVPDYNLIVTQITNTYEDGTIRNGIISINVMIPNNDYRYDFRIDLPVTNGLIQLPSYMMRGRNLVPLTQQDLYNEINTFSFRKLEPNYSYKKNPFSNTGENPLRKPDTQKFYEVENQLPPTSSISEDHKWKAYKQRGMI